MKNYILISLFLVFISCGGGSTSGGKTSNKAPSTPGLIYPESNMLCINNIVTFNWSASEDPEGDTIKYEIQVSESSSFTTILHTEVLAGLSRTYSLEKGKIYYWRVKAIDATDASSDFGNVYQFYTEGVGVVNYIPFLPSLISPTLNEIVNTQTVKLEWLASDVDVNDTLVYDIYFGENSTPSLLVADHTTKNYTTSVSDSKTYYWRIDVKDNAGAKAIGKTWVFKTD